MDKLPNRYTEGLTTKQKTELKSNIERTRKLVEKGKQEDAVKLAEKRPQPKNIKTRKSQFTTKLENLYGVDKLPSTPSREFVKLTGIPMREQEEIIQRGKQAFLTAGSRRGTNAFAWSKARLYAFVVKAVIAKKKGDEKINQDNDIFEKLKNKIKMP